MVTKSGVLHDQDLLLLGAPYPLTVESDKMLRKEKQSSNLLTQLTQHACLFLARHTRHWSEELLDVSRCISFFQLLSLWIIGIIDLDD